MSITTFPPLHSTDARGKTRQWSIWVEPGEAASAVVVTESGLIDGALVQTRRVVSSGKNIGKSNETTAYEQALSEAQSAWTKKNESIECAEQQPMLALDYKKRGHNIVFPCWIQGKIDGIRALFHVDQGRFLTRRGNEFVNIDHIQRAMEHIHIPGVRIWDGELYSIHCPEDILAGLVRRATTELSAEDSALVRTIRFHVFDCVLDDAAAPFSQRKEVVEHAWFDGEALTHVAGEICYARKEVDDLLADYTAQGFEGIMLRNLAGIYRMNTRSKDLQKYKYTEDKEFLIVGYETSRGTEEGAVQWICSTDSGAEFSVRPRGTVESRRALAVRAKTHVGKYLKVRYQNLTAEGKPRFPVGIAIRDYE